MSLALFGVLGCGSGEDQLDQSLSPSAPALVLSGFSETLVANGIANPTAMEFAPDGRLFVGAQGGQLRVVKNGALLPTPFVSLPVDSAGERGLLGVTVDPNFASNNFVYVYYTATTPAPHNRVSRFTANGDVAVPGSEVVLLELENLSAATNHNGGVIHFLADGRLYVAVGENANSANSQSIGTRLGKMLRINSDGSIPTDNPSSFAGIAGTTSGVNRAIWAVGLRNPFTFAVQPGSGRMFINDVGAATWEEINDGIAGRNYGWPSCEGSCGNPNFANPLFAYDHSGGVCAITGGAFYNPTTQQFPGQYIGKYFFADYCAGWIRYLDPSTSAVTDFASGIANPVDLKVHSDGSLYYLAYGAGAVFKIQFTGSQAPSITTHPSNQTVTTGQSATFSVTATGAAPLSYQWQKNGSNIAGATAASYATPPTSAGDNGATYRCVVSNASGSATSSAATLAVTGNTAPTATITTPANNSLYSAGGLVNYSGTGSDAQDGTLPASAFTWQVDFGHDTHFHPFVPATSGSTAGSFTIPTSGETAANVFYRIILTVRDSGGLTNTTSVDIRPRTSTMTLASIPSGLQLNLDGQPVTTPFSVLGVQGVTRQLAAPSPQTAAGRNWIFSAWSDGGAAAHGIATPTVNTTFTAIFQDAGPALAFVQDPGPDGLLSIEAEHFDAQVTQGGHSWTPVTPSGASGSALAATPDNGALLNTGYTTASPRLDYQVNFVKTGVHYLWVRGAGPLGMGADDSCHAGLDGQALDTADRIGSYPTSLAWLNWTMDGPLATISIATTGVHTINLWMREDGFVADKLVVTTNANYSPTGAGPAESLRTGGVVTPTVTPPSSTASRTFTATATATPAAAPGAWAIDQFTRASLGADWFQFTESGAPTQGIVQITDGANAQGEGGADAGAGYSPFVPTAGSAYSCIQSTGAVQGLEACTCLGVVDPDGNNGVSGDALCCCLKEGGHADHLAFELFGWNDGTPINPVPPTALTHAAGDYMAITRSGDAFQCWHAPQANPIAWTPLINPTPISVAGITDPGRGGVYFYGAALRATQFEVGNGSAPPAHVCGATTPPPTGPANTATATNTPISTPVNTLTPTVTNAVSTSTVTQTPTVPTQPPASPTPGLPSSSPTPSRTQTPSSSPTPSQTPALPSPSPLTTPLGLTTIGSILDSHDSNYLNGSRVFTSAGGQVVSLSVYVAAVDAASANRGFQMAIYTDTGGRPGALVATTAAGTLVANAWNTLPITASLQPNANYWLMYNTNGQSSDINNMRYNSGSPGQGVYSATNVPFGTWPSTFPASVATNAVYSLYASPGP